MMNKFVQWLDEYRTQIGYTVGFMNLLMGLSYGLIEVYGLSILWIVIGSFIIYDTYSMAKKYG